MRVVCENCGATYKIPDTKLVKEVNKATCRKCGFRMMIRRPQGRTSSAKSVPDSAEASTVVTGTPGESIQNAETRNQHSDETEWSEEAPTQMKVSEIPPPPEVSSAPIPSPDSTSPRLKPLSEPQKPRVLLPMFGACMACVGTLLLAWNVIDSTTQQALGLFLGLHGALIVIWWGLASLVKMRRLFVVLGVVGLAAAAGGSTALMTQAIIHFETGGSPQATNAATATARSDSTKDAAEELVGDLAEDAGDALTDAAKTLGEKIDPVEPVKPVEEVEEVEDDLPPKTDAELQRERRIEEERQRLETQRRIAEADRKRIEEERRAKEAKTQGRAPMKTLPLTAVDTMLRSNYSVKRCFVSEKKRSGNLPKRVSVKFTILPTGTVSSARVTNTGLKGGPLDSCLRRAFRAIRFPAFEGQAMSMTYPFVM